MNGHPLLGELRDAVSGDGDGSDVRAHVEVCLACRVRMARIAQHGEFDAAAPNVVRAVIEASEVVPGVAVLASAVADREPAAGELWRVGDDEALLVWVRGNFGDGAVDVVPVVLDVAFADEYSVLVSAADSPLAVDMAVLVSLRVHIHRGAFIDCLGSLDVTAQVENVVAAMRDGRVVLGSVPPVESDDDERVEYRQVMRDLLAEWSPSVWLEGGRFDAAGSEVAGVAQLDAVSDVGWMQVEIGARIDSALCLPVEEDYIAFGDGHGLTTLFKVDFLDTAVFVGSVESLNDALSVQVELLAACERALLPHPDADAVCVVETRDEWPCLLYTRASMRSGYELPTGSKVPPRPVLDGLGLVDTLWKHLDGAVVAWEATERATGVSGMVDIAAIAGGHARFLLDQVRKQGTRAHQPAKRLAWSGLSDDLRDRVELFVASVADDVPVEDALARLLETSEA